MSLKGYDQWKTTPPRDRADEYAQGQMDSLDFHEMITKATELKLLEKDAVFEAIRQALYEHFYEEYES